MKKFLIAALIVVTGMASVAIPAAQAASSITITGDDGLRIRNGDHHDRRHMQREDRRDFRRHRERKVRRLEVRENCRTRTVKERHHGKIVVKTVSVCG